jgi:flavin reductase (DIM6/NTAB) family NADH-FMN oxidoreductase RutF
MTETNHRGLVSLDVKEPIWERFFTVAPLVLIGTLDEGGEPDLAPKHMAFPMGWDNYFGFVCTPSHSTYQNIKRSRGFAVSYPRPADLVAASLTASPRCEEAKPIVGLLDTFPASEVEGVFLEAGYLFLECELDRLIDGFGVNSLVTGRVVAAYADDDALRGSDRDDGEVLLDSPQLAYLYPGRFAVIDRTQAFPFPAGMRR